MKKGFQMTENILDVNELKARFRIKTNTLNIYIVLDGDIKLYKSRMKKQLKR